MQAQASAETYHALPSLEEAGSASYLRERQMNNGDTKLSAVALIAEHMCGANDTAAFSAWFDTLNVSIIFEMCSFTAGRLPGNRHWKLCAVSL